MIILSQAFILVALSILPIVCQTPPAAHSPALSSSEPLQSNKLGFHTLQLRTPQDAAASTSTAASQTPTATMAPAPATKDRITCHILDTTTGRPARGVRVRLEGATQASTGRPAMFESHTDDDGRVNSWLSYSLDTASGDVPVYTLDDVLDGMNGSSTWTLHFDTEGYFGQGKTFFPEAVVVFRFDQGQTYHVPLLLSQNSYTTYRGS